MFNHRINLYEEKELNNPQDIMEQRNKEKINLRKIKINQEIQKKRKQNLELLQLKKESKINPDIQFIILRFEESYPQILSYLKSNDNDLITYEYSSLNVSRQDP